ESQSVVDAVVPQVDEELRRPRVRATARKKYGAPRISVPDGIVLDDGITPCFLNGWITVHPELRQLSADHAEEPDVVEESALHQVVKAISTARRPFAMHFHHKTSLARVERS